MQPQQQENYWQTDQPDPSVQDYSEGTPLEEDEDLEGAITWQASEFIHHEKSIMWFIVLFVGAILLLLIDVVFVKSWTFGVLIVVLALGMALLGRRPPRTLHYALTSQGVRIEDKLYSFHDFHAFGVVQESALYSLRLVPNKRFMPMVSLYFPPDQGEQIVDMVGSVLPMEHIDRDPIDKIVEKIRF